MNKAKSCTRRSVAANTNSITIWRQAVN